MVVNRTVLLEAKKISEMGFLQEPECVTGNTVQAVEFFPRAPLNSNPILTGSDLIVYEENCRLKGRFKMRVHDLASAANRFHPGVNFVRMIFDDRFSGDEAYAFVEFKGIDLVDIEDPDFDVDDKNKCSINIRFVMKGFQEADKFFISSDEQTNWLKGFGVNLWLYQKKKLIS